MTLEKNSHELTQVIHHDKKLSWVSATILSLYVYLSKHDIGIPIGYILIHSKIYALKKHQQTAKVNT